MEKLNFVHVPTSMWSVACTEDRVCTCRSDVISEQKELHAHSVVHITQGEENYHAM